MSATDWKRIKNVFHEALRFEAGERESFLERECGQDLEMRVEVESLLLSLNEAKDFLEQPPILPPTPIGSTVLLPGQQISHYKIVSHIATGGMGEIYLAEDQKLRRKVALKVLHEIMPASAEQLKRFQREAALVSSLNHPNILTIYDIDTEGGIHLFASEFVDGVTLRERLNEKMPVAEALNITIQILSALQAAHEAGITHRDIKPENIMLRSDGLVKVLDFGLAKVAKLKRIDASEPTWEQIFSRPGMIIGTAAYMSPEQARGQQLDARSDIFSLGVVLYEMLTGNTPFVGQTATDIIASLIQDEVRPPSILNPDVSPEIDRVVIKMLEKDRNNRHQSALEILSDVRREKDLLNHAEPVNSTSENVSQPTGDQAELPMPARDATMSRMTQALLIIVVLIAVAMAVYLFVS